VVARGCVCHRGRKHVGVERGTQAVRGRDQVPRPRAGPQALSAEEGDRTFTNMQYEALTAASARLPWIAMRHCAASASVLTAPDMALEMVRAGLGIYGYHPAPNGGDGIDLRPVLSLKSRIARLVEVEPGATVGYGRTWTASRPSKIALIMCGYADGYRRALSNRASVLVRGHRAPIAGRIAMDMCMADVTGVPAVAPDDEVVIMGRQGPEAIDAGELAELADTISWEILAGISARVPRIYLRDGAAVALDRLGYGPGDGARVGGARHEEVLALEQSCASRHVPSPGLPGLTASSRNCLAQ